MYLKLNTEFTPFTYDEMVKPLLSYKDAYEKLESEYSDLVTLTEAWADIANRENSPEAYNMYNRYSTLLNNIVDDFSGGMTSSNRRALLGMKRGYAKNIKPISDASTAMKEANTFRDEKGPDAIFEVSRYNSLDSFLHGKTANNRYQSREALVKKSAAISEAIAKEAIKDPEFKKIMGSLYWQVVSHTGGSYKDLLEALKLAIADDPIVGNIFSQARQKILLESGYENYDEEGQRAIIEAVNLGLYNGLDKPAYDYKDNQGYLNPLLIKQMNQIGQSSGGGGGGRGGGGSGRYYYSKGKGSSETDNGEKVETYSLDKLQVYRIKGNGNVENTGDEFDDNRPYQKTWIEYEGLDAISQKAAEKIVGRLNVRFYLWRQWKGSNGDDHVEYFRKDPAPGLKLIEEKKVGDGLGIIDY